MKTILLAPTPPPHGGIAEWTQRMLRSELKNGWELDIVDEKLYGKRELFSTRRHLIDEIKRTYRIWSDLNAKTKDSDVKVVHSCIAATTFAMIREYVCAIISKKNNCKFIIHFRCTVPNIISSKMEKFVLKLLCNQSDCILSLNQQTCSYLERITKTKQVLIPNFVDESEHEKFFEVREKIKRIIYVGGIIQSKGCDDILHLAKFFPNIEFVMVGNVDADMQRIIDKMGLNNITITGSMLHDQVIEYLYNADVFVFLSRFKGEGFSNALVEAMAIGLPCLVTDWAANKDMIEDKGGIVVRIHDIQSAVAAIENMQNKELRERMSEWNQKKVNEKYSAKIVTCQYVDVYEDLVERD